MVVLTFQYLRELQKKERELPGLQPIDSNFYKALSECLKSTSDENTIAIAKSIFDMRERKIIGLAIRSSRADIKPGNVLPEEEPLFQNICNVLKEFRQSIEGIFAKEEVPAVQKNAQQESKPETAQETIPSHSISTTSAMPTPTISPDSKHIARQIQMVKVRAMADIHGFLGEDMKAYGPFKAGETAEIPKKAAEILVKSKSAEPVN